MRVAYKTYLLYYDKLFKSVYLEGMMPNIFYTSESGANHSLLAEKIRNLEPDYVAIPLPKSMEELYNLASPEEILEIHKRVLDVKLPVDYKPIFTAAKDIGASIKCVDDDELHDRSHSLFNTVLVSMSSLYLSKGILVTKTNKEDIENSFIKIEAKKGLIRHYIDKYMCNELEREQHMSESLEGNVVGCFKDVNFSMCAQGEFIGEIVMNPLEKLVLLKKFKRLGLDIDRIRSEDPGSDCDPEKDYFNLAMDWIAYRSTFGADLPYMMALRSFYGLQ